MLNKSEPGTILNQRYTVYDKDTETFLTNLIGTTFVILNILLSLVLTLLFFRKRNHFPIRGRAPYLSLLQSLFANIVLMCPPLAAVLWINNITSVYGPTTVPTTTKILASIEFVSRRFLYATWFIKI